MSQSLAFPRLNERGSIEARIHNLTLYLSLKFPRLNERGSIEARLLLLRHSGLHRVSTFE